MINNNLAVAITGTVYSCVVTPRIGVAAGVCSVETWMVLPQRCCNCAFTTSVLHVGAVTFPLMANVAVSEAKTGILIP